MSDKLEKCRMFLMHQRLPVWQPGPTKVKTMASGGTPGFQALDRVYETFVAAHSEIPSGIKHGNGKYTIYRCFSYIEIPISSGFPVATFDTGGCSEPQSFLPQALPTSPGCGGVFVDADGHIGPLPPGLADSLHIPVMKAGWVLILWLLWRLLRILRDFGVSQSC